MALAIASQLWGGCVSCQKFVLEARQATECCGYEHKCDRMPGQSSRQTPSGSKTEHPGASCDHAVWLQAPAPGVSVQLAWEYANFPVAAFAGTVADGSDCLDNGAHRSPDPPGVPAPDIPVLHASLLI
ncbi:MAG: hypothetical protein R2729_07265 [Bryobacteraceae bacterium]